MSQLCAPHGWAVGLREATAPFAGGAGGHPAGRWGQAQDSSVIRSDKGLQLEEHVWHRLGKYKRALQLEASSSIPVRDGIIKDFSKGGKDSTAARTWSSPFS